MLCKANQEIASLKDQLKQVHTTEKTSTTDATEQAGEETNTDVTTMPLQIYSGITPYSVAQKLEDGGIITNSVEMELLLANPKYARSLQIGSYEVHSSMTIRLHKWVEKLMYTNWYVLLVTFLKILAL